jgi:hypothetical protein
MSASAYGFISPDFFCAELGSGAGIKTPKLLIGTRDGHENFWCAQYILGPSQKKVQSFLDDKKHQKLTRIFLNRIRHVSKMGRFEGIESI